LCRAPANGGHYRVFTPYWRAWRATTWRPHYPPPETIRLPGVKHAGQLLADGDVACNAGNWQWVAGTGNSTRPNRVMNPLRQAQRFDPAGEYVRRYVPELAGLDPQYLQTPWKSKAGHLGYPDPIVELGGGSHPRSVRLIQFFWAERSSVPAARQRTTWASARCR
jgi:deoxyribodipyrimidine photolyase